MEEFLDTYDHAKLNQGNHISIYIPWNEIEAAIKSPKKENSTNWWIFCWILSDVNELIPTLLKLFCEIEREGILPAHSMKPVLHSSPKQRHMQKGEL
jgi:hypothetical protein